MKLSHLSIKQSGLTSLFVMIVGQLVAFVPAFGPDKQALIAAGTTVIAAVFLIANAIHAVVASKVTAGDLEGGVQTLVKSELDKVDFNALVKDGLSGQNLSALVQGELSKILSAAAVRIPAAAPAASPAGTPGPTA
jgi:hypothetical protein